MRFLPVGVPYHSHLLAGATAAALAAINATDAQYWVPSNLAFAVYNTFDGSDLRSLTSSLLESLLDQIFEKPIYWSTKATNFPLTASHALDFGTGGSSGIGSLCVRNWEGRGIRTIMVGNRAEGVGAGSEAWGGVVHREERWDQKFRPRLVKTSDGKIHIDTPFSRLLNKPPLMVAGM
jgi:fatty acid synthase subunit beta